MGKKRVTSHDVARLAGVSRSVVSAVLNDTPGIGVSAQTREAVLHAIAELNYHVDAQARSMKTGRSMTLAAFGDTRHPLFMRLLEGMQRECEVRGYHILLCSPGERKSGEARRALLDLYHQRKIDGIITLDETSYRSADWAAKIQEAAVPYVSVEGYAETEGVYSVLADYRGSVLTALDYLCRDNMSGETAPAPVYVEVFHGAASKRSNWAEQNRRNAYKEWCSLYGLKPVIHRLDEQEGTAGWLKLLSELNHRKADEMKQQNTDGTKEQTLDDRTVLPPLLLNWSSAVPDIYRAAHALGLAIGDSLRIMAADNTIQGDRLSVPTLSCVEIPYVGMGEEAVRCLLKQMEQEAGEPAKLWLPAVLKPGESA
ncbi:LacI family DNA-binding transcriptional regulator [Paenibacillus camerounensis]|uniref:LacI family DNA-binding transcriptional regulator n=1 Tax=Paenibacillus camerounensis TaxID=1243663 RepID=UPI0005A663BD|nr:LacI family DNA-binding transcriptional regulator [Paenibacillus camerounensis]